MNVRLLNKYRCLQKTRNEIYPKLRFSMKTNCVYVTFHCEQNGMLFSFGSGRSESSH